MIKHTLLRLATLLFYFTLGTLYAQQQTVILQVNESSPIWSQKLPSGGMGSEIIEAISKEMDMKTNIEFIPLKRLIADITNNDLGNPLFYMDNQEFAAIIPIALSYSSFFTYKNDAQNVFSNILPKERRIGILKGTLSKKGLSEHLGFFDQSSSHKSLFKKLKAGRLDLVMELSLVGIETLKNLYPNSIDDFYVEIIPQSVSPIAILIDIDYPNANAIALLYKEGLSRIIKNGVYQSILEKYYKQNTIPDNWYSDLSKFTAIYFREKKL